MPENFADRLLAAITAKGSPVCVGIDPVYEKLPEDVRRLVESKPDQPQQEKAAGQQDSAGRPQDAEGMEKVAQLVAMGAYCRIILELVAPHVPAIKIQSAYFEAYGAVGVAAYFEVVKAARKLGLIVIGDVKRNDIGPTAQAYARAHLAGPDAPDAVTVNGYFGADGIMPFVEVARAEGKGLFVLVRTSNKSAADIQDFADASGTKFYRHMAAQVAAIGDGEGLTGKSGFSCVGAVVGATWPGEAKELRQAMPRQIFLVPGYGAQGATAADCAAAFDRQGRGAIVNASRSVIFAHNEKQYAGVDWKQAITLAAQAFAKDIAQAAASASKA
ncbi:MAG: orotidine-5'-phosphate decarboxylase [Planctomycetes bacterium]|nr:orotidine-5'-phosphate decarboxylase [Planctomycetota bacterium]